MVNCGVNHSRVIFEFDDFKFFKTTTKKIHNYSKNSNKNFI